MIGGMKKLLFIIAVLLLPVMVLSEVLKQSK